MGEYNIPGSGIVGFEDAMATGMDMEFLSYFLIVYLVGMLIALVYSVVVYVLQSVGMYTIANRRGIHNPWLAWIPVANMWTLGSISDQYQYVAKGKVRNRRKTLLGLNIAMVAIMIPFFISFVSFTATAASITAMGQPDLSEIMGPMLAVAGLGWVMMILAIVATVFTYIAYYDLFASCNPENAAMFLVLSIFFSFLLPYFVFFSRKKLLQSRN